jgi:hypothetical protein
MGGLWAGARRTRAALSGPGPCERWIWQRTGPQCERLGGRAQRGLRRTRSRRVGPRCRDKRAPERVAAWLGMAPFPGWAAAITDYGAKREVWRNHWGNPAGPGHELENIFVKYPVLYESKCVCGVIFSRGASEHLQTTKHCKTIQEKLGYPGYQGGVVTEHTFRSEPTAPYMQRFICGQKVYFFNHITGDAGGGFECVPAGTHCHARGEAMLVGIVSPRGSSPAAPSQAPHPRRDPPERRPPSGEEGRRAMRVVSFLSPATSNALRSLVSACPARPPPAAAPRSRAVPSFGAALASEHLMRR